MKAKLFLTVEGGIVQSITSDKAELFRDVDVILLDYDTEGADETELAKVTCVGEDDHVEAVFNEQKVGHTAIKSIIFDQLEVLDAEI